MGLCLVCVRDFLERLFHAMHGDGVWGWFWGGGGELGFDCTTYTLWWLSVWLEVCTWQLLKHRLLEGAKYNYFFKIRVGGVAI
jgi:hypothetical protein